MHYFEAIPQQWHIQEFIQEGAQQSACKVHEKFDNHAHQLYAITPILRCTCTIKNQTFAVDGIQDVVAIDELAGDYKA